MATLRTELRLHLTGNKVICLVLGTLTQPQALQADILNAIKLLLWCLFVMYQQRQCQSYLYISNKVGSDGT